MTNEQLAVKSMPVLVRYARRRKMLTYEDLNNHIQGGTNVGMGRVLGIVRDRTQRAGVPMLTSIVINKNTRKPGDDWLPERDKPWLHSLSEAKRDEYWRQQTQLVFNFRFWDAFLLRNGFPAKEAMDGSGGWGGGESEAHWRLKQSIRDDPGMIGLNPVRPATTEYALPSGDEIDVYVETAGSPRLHAVEIKIDDPEEIRRGVYQAIKYRALLAASNGIELSSPEVGAHLAMSGPVPPEAIELAEKYRVKIHVIPVTRT